ncbi:extracellular solute-binding protein [Cohnella endophytica]|uniref:Extracellular solute-binding protein n=1 Tax=Cohnella endophytica TaxID=2419778 RepID=A0A494Y0J6_9BACL|nr:extracellular solute-binding protein [Cohnella endophytica]RKP56289.1 extracellular solute-binding protein [Cohnella endophytica]
MIKKKGFKAASLLMLCGLMIALSACGSTKKNNVDKASTSPSVAASETPAPSESAPVKIINVEFYGKIVEFSSTDAMMAEVKDELKDKYKINDIQVDWGNLEKVVKTGIASGTPADVYQFWPQAMKTFVDNGQALDLTPYLEADGGKWKDSFNQTLLDIGKYDGKYYNVPLASNFSLMIVNKDLFEKAGLTVSDTWSWDQFMAANQALKDKAGTPFGFASHGNPDWLFRNGIMSLAKDQNKLEDLAAGKIAGNDPIYGTTLDNIKKLYDSQLWYPGKGALTATMDENKSAFLQGKVGIIGWVASDTAAFLKSAQEKGINAVVVGWPTMGSSDVILGGADGLFIPANAPHPEAAVEVLKTYLGDKVQAINAAAGYPTGNKNAVIEDPNIKKVVGLAAAIFPHELEQLSPKLTDYVEKQILANYVLGGSSLKDVASDLDKLIKEATAAK